LVNKVGVLINTEKGSVNKINYPLLHQQN